MSKTLGIMGCGWLGLPLAISLIKDGYKIHGTTTSVEKLSQLKQEHIIPFQITLSEDNIEGAITNFLQNVDILIVNVPPKLRGEHKENYVKKINLLQKKVRISSVTKVVFISSTAIYGDAEGEVTEHTTPQPSTESGKQLLISENSLMNDSNFETTVIRFGGLIGPKRHPITMLSKKQNLSNGEAPINLIHLDDCIRIITSVITQSWWNETINGVYPLHPSKENYYTKEAVKRNLQSPKYKTNNSSKSKIVLSEFLLNVKNFQFITTV